MPNDARLEHIHAELKPILRQEQLELVEATCTGPSCRTHVHIFVHAPGGVPAQTLGRIHRSLEAVLDEKGVLLSGTYHMEVATPGLNRPLKTTRDFERNLGADVHLFLTREISGKREWDGRIEKVAPDWVTLAVEHGSQRFPLDAINFAKIRIDSHFAPKPKKPKKTKSTRQGAHH